MRAQSAWNVPSHSPSTGRPRIAPTRSRISRAALLVRGGIGSSQCFQAVDAWRFRATTCRGLRLLRFSGPYPQDVRDRISEFRAIERIEVELIYSVGLEQPHLLGGHHGRHYSAGLQVVIEPVEHMS